jgi:AraC-like DNA-binding protein
MSATRPDVTAGPIERSASPVQLSGFIRSLLADPPPRGDAAASRDSPEPGFCAAPATAADAAAESRQAATHFENSRTSTLLCLMRYRALAPPRYRKIARVAPGRAPVENDTAAAAFKFLGTTMATAPATRYPVDPTGSVSVRTLFRSRLVDITHWHCHFDGPVLRNERSHGSHVLSVVHAGACVLHVGGRAVVVDASTVVLYAPGDPYRTTHPFGCDDRGCHIAVREDMLEEARARAGHGVVRAARRSQVLLAPPRGYQRHFLLFRRLQSGSSLDPIAVEETVLALLEDALTGQSRLPGAPAGRARAHRELVDATRSLLSMRFRDPLQLDDVARAVGASPSHVARVFRAGTGLPIHRYLVRLRLLSALEPAADRTTDLTALALEQGFSSHSHFTAAFRREFGVPPAGLRRIGAG